MNPSRLRKQIGIYKPTYLDAGGGAKYPSFVLQHKARAEIVMLPGGAVKEELEGKQDVSVATHSIRFKRRDLGIKRDWELRVLSPKSDTRVFTVTMSSPPNDPAGFHAVHCKERAK